MKKIICAFLIASAPLLFSCSEGDGAADTALFAVPVQKSLAEIRSSVGVAAARQTSSDGKIYVAQNLMFYIAQESGVHVFNNANPASPTNLAFLNIPGVHDIAVKGQYLYADNFVDMLVFDLSDLNNISLIQTLQEAVSFYPDFPADAEFGADTTIEAGKIVVGYTTERRARPQYGFVTQDGLENGIPAALPGNAVGTGGSYARFQINQNALYVVESYSLKVFNLTNPGGIFFSNEVAMQMWFNGGAFETLYKQGSYLFVGASSGMYVVDASDPFSPQFISAFSHATACDPVVVNGTTAYITVRGGSLCGAIEDQVNVIDISDIYAPSLQSTYLLDQPKGLGVKGNTVYICCSQGLKVFDASNPEEMVLLHTYNDQVTDVIPLEDRLIAVGNNLIKQYHYGAGGTLLLISQLEL